MQLQKSVSALQVDRSKSHTIFSIPWSISLAPCWYSWSIADSSPCERTCNPCFSESCQQFQQILMSMKDNSNFLLSSHRLLHCYFWISTSSFSDSMCLLSLGMPVAHNLPWKLVVWLGFCQRPCWCHALWILSFLPATPYCHSQPHL